MHSRSERNTNDLNRNANKFIEKTEGSTTSTENEKESVDSFFRKDEQVVGVELGDISVYTKKSLILAQDER